MRLAVVGVLGVIVLGGLALAGDGEGALDGRVAGLEARLRVESLRGDYLEARCDALEATEYAHYTSVLRYTYFIDWFSKPTEDKRSAWRHVREDRPLSESIKDEEAAMKARAAAFKAKRVWEDARKALGG